MSQKFKDVLFVITVVVICFSSGVGVYDVLHNREALATCEARLEAQTAPEPVEAAGAPATPAATLAPVESTSAALPVATEAAPAVDPATDQVSGVTVTAPGQ